MTRSHVTLLLVALPLALVAIGLRSAPAPAQADTLAASDQLHWYRGNMHTHSHWSDGDDYLESIASWYQTAGYQFLVFTDHNVLADKERWVEISKTKGKQAAFDKLKQQFPDWLEVRTVEGRHEVHLGDATYTLEPGDSITYSSRLPHWYRNPGDEPVRSLWVITPPTF